MQYRYSRGQPGQGSLPRPAWGSGSGSHAARTASPEPGGTGSTPLGSGTPSEPKERTGAASQEEVIVQLEKEVLELRNLLSWKDQQIAELSRTDTPAGRLKRDIRHLASELHHTRKELSESVREAQDLRSQLELGEVSSNGRDGAPRDIVDSPSAAGAGRGSTPTSGGHGTNNTGSSGRGSTAGGDRGSMQLRGRVVELEEENRQLRETVVQIKAQGLADNLHQSHARQPSGASTQRAAEPTPPSSAQPGNAATPGTSGAGGNTAFGAGIPATRQSYMNQQATPSQAAVVASAPAAGAPAAAPAPEEPVRQTVYSSHSLENVATIGPTTLQGVGTVDGVAMVAKVLLQRIHSSVCAAHRRPPPNMAVSHEAARVPLMIQQMPLT